MFRLLLLLVVIGVAGYFTNPTEAVHQAQAQAALQANADNAGQTGNVLEKIGEKVGAVIDQLGGEGRYETFYVASKYTLELPTGSHVECYGAFTMVKCTVINPA